VEKKKKNVVSVDPEETPVSYHTSLSAEISYAEGLLVTALLGGRSFGPTHVPGMRDLRDKCCVYPGVGRL
jgi:hypothetical protein